MREKNKNQGKRVSDYDHQAQETCQLSSGIVQSV